MATWNIRSQKGQLRLPYHYFPLARNSMEGQGEFVPLAAPKRKAPSKEKNRRFLAACAQGGYADAGLSGYGIFINDDAIWAHSASCRSLPLSLPVCRRPLGSDVAAAPVTYGKTA